MKAFKLKRLHSKFIYIGLFLFGLIMSKASFSFSQEDDDDKPVRPRKFITLTLGIEHDEKLTNIPDYIAFKGDFKSITSASYSKEINTLRFVPKKEGLGTLTVHDKKGKILIEYRLDVRKSRLDAIMKEMKSLLGDIEGIQLKVVNNKVIVDGQILLSRDLSRIYNVVSQFGDQATSIVTLSPLAQKKIAEFITRDINDAQIEVRAYNDKIVLSGTLCSQDESNRAEIIAKTYLPAKIVEPIVNAGILKEQKPANDGVVNLIKIKNCEAPEAPAKMVQIVVHYVELQKDFAKDFRFQFMPTLSDQSGIGFKSSTSAPGGILSEFTGVISNLLPKLNWSKSHGHAKILEATSIIVKEGKEGTLMNMQQVGFTSLNMGDKGTAQTPVEVGINMKVTPVILGERSDSINLDMGFGISNLIGSAGDSPLTSKNSVITSVIVRSGQSAAIGGLISSRSSTNYNKLPKTNGGSPILSLYASRDFVKNQSQFVVFVTPTIRSSASSGAEKLKKKLRLSE